jgi:hypothetical protein
MKPIPPDPYLQVYMLLRQDGLYFMPTGPVSTTMPSSTGFYASKKEAEMARTHQVLSNKDTNNYQYHIFELEIPNPAYDIQSHQRTQNQR